MENALVWRSLAPPGRTWPQLSLAEPYSPGCS